MFRNRFFKLSSLTLLCAVGLTGSSAVYAESKPLDNLVNFNAEARVRYEFFNNTDFNDAIDDKRDFATTRVRPSLLFTPHEQISVLFQPQFAVGWGETLNTSLSSVNAASVGSASGGLDEPSLGIHQAYLAYSPSDSFTMTVGRQELVYGDQLVIGSVDWNNTGRSFDALKFKYSQDKYFVDLFYSILSDAEAAASRGACAAPCQSGDQHFMGIYGSIDAATWLKNLDLYAFYRYDDTVDPQPHNYVTFGTRLKGNKNAVDYRVEATGQFGKTTVASGTETDVEDYQVDAEVGYTFEDLKKFRIGIEGFITSENYLQLFPTAHKWLGYIDLFGRRNIMGGVARLSIVPNEKWKVAFDAHTLFRTSTDRGLFALNGLGEIDPASASDSKLAGEELDLIVSYAPMKLIKFDLGLNTFAPMGFIKDDLGDSLPVFGYLQTSVKF